jgi:hypothetical protein
VARHLRASETVGLQAQSRTFLSQNTQATNGLIAALGLAARVGATLLSAVLTPPPQKTAS